MQQTAVTTKGANTRARLLQEARALLINEGYDQFTLRQVAKQADANLGSLQYHFSTRDKLLEALLENEFVAEITILEELSNGKATDPSMLLQSIVKKLVAGWRGESGIIFGTFAFLAMQKQSFLVQRKAVYRRFLSEVTKGISHYLPDLPEKACKDRAYLLMALIDGAAMQTDTKPKQESLNLVAAQAAQIVFPEFCD